MTDTTLPDPLVPAEVDLRDFGFMPLDVRTLLSSSLWIKAKKDPRVAHAAVSLWCEAWHQVPAGSLPDDDEVLAELARCDEKEWKRIRERALLHFVKCSDGRLYHRHVTAKALESWEAKQAQRARTRKATEAKERARREAEEARRAERDDVRDEARDVQRNDARDDARDASRDVHQGTGTGTGTGIKEKDNPVGLSVDGDPPPTDGRPALTLVPPQPELPDCPHQELIALYRKHLPHLRQPLRWDGERAEAMRTRWRECSKPSAFGDGYRTRDEGLAFWDRFFAYVASVEKLRDGIRTRDGGQERLWKPDLAWLIGRANFTKVIEGAYA